MIDETNEDDPEVTDTIPEEINRLMDKIDPWRRQIMIILFIVLILLVVFLGFAYGGLKVCNDLDGILDDKFKCHPNYKPKTIDRYGNEFTFPEEIIENVGTE